MLVDVDRTLLDTNSAYGWILGEMRAGYITAGECLKAFSWLIRYRLGNGNVEDAFRRSIMLLQGSYEDDLIRRCHRFIEDRVWPRLRPGAITALEKHVAAGDHVCLLTSGSHYIAEPLAERLRIGGSICSRFVVDTEGRFTGEAEEPLCFGDGKRLRALAYARRYDLDLGQATFYTDSIADLPVLDVVARPVAVHPDPRLRRLAEKRNWPIVDWGSSKVKLNEPIPSR